MFKRRSFGALMALAVLAAASAFAASPPSTASPPHAAVKVEVAKDVSPVSLTVAETGSGAASAFKAWTQKAQSATAPVQRVLKAAGLGWEHRVLAASGSKVLGESGCETCRTAHGPGDGDGDDDAQDNSGRRLLT